LVLVDLVERKNLSIKQLRKMIFGWRTEKRRLRGKEEQKEGPLRNLKRKPPLPVSESRPSKGTVESRPRHIPERRPGPAGIRNIRREIDGPISYVTGISIN